MTTRNGSLPRRRPSSGRGARSGRAWLLLAIVVACGSAGCQVLLGIDSDVAVSADASTSGDSDTADASAPETAADAAEENFNVYVHGQFDNSWQADDASGVSQDDLDTTGGSTDPPYDIKVVLSREGGAWGALAPEPFDTSDYGALQFRIRSTVTHQTWNCYLSASDGGTLTPVNIVAQDGGWEGHTIDLTSLGASKTMISSLMIQDTTGAVGNVWYVDDIGFVP